MASPTIPQPPSLPLTPTTPTPPSIGTTYRTGNKKNTGQAPGPKKSSLQSVSRKPDPFKQTKVEVAKTINPTTPPTGPVSFLQNGQWKLN